MGMASTGIDSGITVVSDWAKSDSTFGFVILCQEFALKPRVRLRGEERRRPRATLAVGSINLIVTKLPDVVDGKQVFAIHQNDYRVVGVVLESASVRFKLRSVT